MAEQLTELGRLAFTVPEVCRALGLGKTSVYALIKAKAIPGVKIGGSIRIPKAALEQWLAQQALTNPSNGQ